MKTDRLPCLHRWCLLITKDPCQINCQGIRIEWNRIVHASYNISRDRQVLGCAGLIVQLHPSRRSLCATTPPFSSSTLFINHLTNIHDQISLHHTFSFLVAIARLKSQYDWTLSIQISCTSSLGARVIRM